MRNKILFVITVVAVLGAAILGILKRSTYTDITAQPDYLDKIQVAVLPEQLAINACELLRTQLVEAPIVAKVEVIGEEEHLFGVTQQKVCVKKQYVGNELVEGSELYIYADQWRMSLEIEPQSIERGFVNILRVGKEYLVFLSEEDEELGLKIPLYKVYGDFIITPVFCYEEIENKPVETTGDHTYVDYSKVSKNEFFGETEKAVEAWEELKEEMLEKYR